MPLQGHKQRVKCNSDLNGEKVWGALRRCPASRGYTQRAEPPVLRVAATEILTLFILGLYWYQPFEFSKDHYGKR